MLLASHWRYLMTYILLYGHSNFCGLISVMTSWNLCSFCSIPISLDSSEDSLSCTLHVSSNYPWNFPSNHMNKEDECCNGKKHLMSHIPSVQGIFVVGEQYRGDTSFLIRNWQLVPGNMGPPAHDFSPHVFTQLSMLGCSLLILPSQSSRGQIFWEVPPKILYSFLPPPPNYIPNPSQHPALS